MAHRLVHMLALSFALGACGASDDPAEGEVVELAPPPPPAPTASNVAAAQTGGPADPPANPELLAASPDLTAPADFRVVLDKYPDSRKIPDALLKIGYCNYELKNYSEARTALRRRRLTDQSFLARSDRATRK